MRSYFVFLIMAIFALSACGSRDSTNDFPDIRNDPRYQPDPDLVFAQDWSKIIIDANSTKTEVRLSGHLSTMRNGCGWPKDGVLESSLWNPLARNINKFLSTAPSTQENCVTLPDMTKKMDGTTQVIVNNTSRALFSYKDGKICGTLSDPALSVELLDEINQVIEIADKIDCPNGYGSER